MKGSDWGADQEVARIFADEAPVAVRELAHWGVPWTRVRPGTNTYFVQGEPGRRARPLLASWGGFRWHEQEARLWKELCELAPGEMPDSKWRRRLRKYFDQMRDPRRQSKLFVEKGLVAFELGVALLRWGDGLVQPGSGTDWGRVVEEVGR